MALAEFLIEAACFDDTCDEDVRVQQIVNLKGGGKLEFTSFTILQ